METVNKKLEINCKIIKEKIYNNPDIIIKHMTFFKTKIAIIFSESMSDRVTINNFILEYLSFEKKKPNTRNIFNYLMEYIPANKISEINTIKDVLYNILSGLTVIMVDGFDKVLTIESKSLLNSPISPAENEKTLKGPKDAFTENYQINIGLLRKRLKTEKLLINEVIVGNIGQSKVGIVSIKGIVKDEIVQNLINKIGNINIDTVFDVNQIIELISENEKNAFPNFLETERPDYAAMLILEGRVGIVLENTPYIAIVPVFIDDFFHSAEDMYNRAINSTATRLIRFVAFLLTLLTPAIYVAITTYNHETIPSKLLINFSIQRDGVPFSTVMEAILMIITFEILKETDARVPTPIGNSLSIVGALVLGDAAVRAGIVSPIMVIVIAITAISGLIISYSDVSNGIRWWRIWFLLAAAFAGVIGIVIAGIIFITNLVSLRSFGSTFMAPYAPFTKGNIGNSFLMFFYNRYFQRNILTSKNKKRQKGD